MLSSLLNRQITIEVETTANNDLGTPVETYTTLKNTFATVSYKTGSTEFTDDYAIASTSTTFTIRYDSRVNYKCRIKFGGYYYKILHIETMGRNEGFRIKTIKFEDD